MDLLTNPVLVSVVVMIILCLFKLNIILALLLSALVAGGVAFVPANLAAGSSVFTAVVDALSKTIGTLVNGMGGQSNTALSYILLGALAVALANTGVTGVLCDKLNRISKSKLVLLIVIAAGSCLSQNLIPVHIAFIPILIPPLLSLFNRLQIDRRGVACALTFGLKMPYIAIPAGFGLIFQGILSDEMAKSGVNVATGQVWHYTWILGAFMILGVLCAIFFTYSRPRVYADIAQPGINQGEARTQFKLSDLLTLVALAIAVWIQIKLDSLPLAALAGLFLLFIFGQLKWNKIEDTMKEGLAIMGMIAFIMLVASGYGDVIRETQAVDHLVKGIVNLIGGSQALGAFLMLLVGLLVTMGIGTSFGTIPVVAAIYCPFGLQLGFTPGAICCLLAAAAALGDAGSPASDSTLGPTSGLNFDGQHDHIWDTCVPTFLHFNIPLIIGGLVGALVLFR